MISPSNPKEIPTPDQSFATFMGLPAVYLRGGRKSFGDREVLRGISLLINKGEVVSVIGPSGAGKSTLLRCLTLLDTFDQGELAYGNVLVAKDGDEGGSGSSYDRQAMRQARMRFGIVFQNFQLLPDQTVHDNLDIVLRAFGVSRSSERESLINEALQDVGLETKSYKYPHELSGGEQQRVAIARALIGRPELILADEPTGNLDAENGLAIAELLHRLTKERGTAVIMATHNRQVLEYYPARCIALDTL